MEKRVELGEGFSVREFVLREMTGEDQINAATMAAKMLTKVQAKIDSVVELVKLRQMIQTTLVSVDGAPVNGDAPFLGLKKWTCKTIGKAEKAFVELNGFTDDDEEGEEDEEDLE